MLPAQVSARSRARIDDFSEFAVGELADLAHLGNEVLHRVAGMRLAEDALTALYLRHLREAPPHEWKALFRDAARMAYNPKYMFRGAHHVHVPRNAREVDGAARCLGVGIHPVDICGTARVQEVEDAEPASRTRQCQEVVNSWIVVVEAKVI